jgi:hypothetical protein
MAESPATAPRERGWFHVLLALAALFLAPQLPPLRALVPVDQTTLLLTPVLASCFVVGWWAGGRVWLAVIWVAVTIFALSYAPGIDPSAYRDLSRAWGLMVAGTFGIACVTASSRPFLPRGLAAVGLAMLLALVLSVIGELPPQRAESVFAAQFALRNAQGAAAAQQLAQLVPGLAGLAEWGIRMMSATAEVGLRLFPALLALQGLAACALAWSLYHRLSRVRIGPPLGRLREFVFGDQFVWGLVAGAALVLLPALSPLQWLGLNLVAFFGALYALRGLGVAVWLLSGRRAPLVAGIAGAAALAGPIAVVAAFGIGVSDTWFDWRGLTRAPSPGSAGAAP